MSWREIESYYKCNREVLQRQGIKYELSKRYLYIEQHREKKFTLKKWESEYREYLKNPVQTTSFIKVSDNTQEKKNKVIEWEGKIAEIKEEIKQIENSLETIDKWLACLTEPQKQVVEEYVCKRACRHVEKVASMLNYSKRAVLKYTSKAIDRIYEVFYENSEKECTQ